MEGEACRDDDFKRVSAEPRPKTPISAHHAQMTRNAHLIRPMRWLWRLAHGARNLADLIHDGPRIVQLTTGWQRQADR